MKADEIMLTDDVLQRYKISRSTLYYWSTPARMPACFSRPFPKPTIGGSPKRWRGADLLKWEEEVNAMSAGTQPLSPDA
jgi:predicted DNA-binding transcriptional regulator AlpA